jgi:tetratricopeptide (TPR) repeat protein
MARSRCLAELDETRFDYLDDIPRREEPLRARPMAGTDGAAAAFERGEGLFLEGRFGAALQAYESATELAPSFFRAHAAAIDALLALGRLDEAQTRAERLLDKFNRNADLGSACAHTYLHRCQRLRAAGDHEGAQERYRQAMQYCEIATESNPQSAYAWLRRGEAALAAIEGLRLLAASGCFQRAVGGRGDWALETHVGMIFLEWGWLGEAERWLAGAAERAPSCAAVRFWLGRTCLAGGEVQRARSWFQQALSLSGDYAEAKAGLAECRFPRTALRKARARLGLSRRAHWLSGSGPNA